MPATRLFVTVPRSGTMDKLALMGAHPCPLELKSEWQPGEILFCHCYDKMMPLVRDAAKRGIQIITARRDHDQSRASTVRIGMSAAETEECIRNYAEVLTLARVVIPHDADADHPLVVVAKSLT